MVDYDKLVYEPLKSHVGTLKGHMFFITEEITFSHDEEKQLREIRTLTGENRQEFLKRMIAKGVEIEVQRLKERNSRL